MTNSDPYRSPENATAVDLTSVTIRRRYLWIALIVFMLPAFTALPLWIWTMHYAGGWLVSERLGPEHRAIHLSWAYAALQATIGCLATPVAALMLYLSRWRQPLTFLLFIAMVPVLLLGLLLTFGFIYSYLQFG